MRCATGFRGVLRRIPAAHEEALRFVREGLDLSGRRFAEGHPGTLAAVVSLANLLRTTGGTDEARDLTERTVARYADAYVPKHLYYFGCLGYLVLLRRSPATSWRPAGLTRTPGRPGPRRHHYSLTVAVDLAALDHPDQARKLGRRSLRRLRALLGRTIRSPWPAPRTWPGPAVLSGRPYGRVQPPHPR